MRERCRDWRIRRNGQDLREREDVTVSPSGPHHDGGDRKAPGNRQRRGRTGRTRPLRHSPPDLPAPARHRGPVGRDSKRLARTHRIRHSQVLACSQRSTLRQARCSIWTENGRSAIHFLALLSLPRSFRAGDVRRPRGDGVAGLVKRTAAVKLARRAAPRKVVRAAGPAMRMAMKLVTAAGVPAEGGGDVESEVAVPLLGEGQAGQVGDGAAGVDGEGPERQVEQEAEEVGGGCAHEQACAIFRETGYYEAEQLADVHLEAVRKAGKGDQRIWRFLRRHS